MCSKDKQEWGEIMKGMYHGNTEVINFDILILKESKGLKNEIVNLYLDMLYNIRSYATGLRQYLLYHDHLVIVLAMGAPQASQVLNLPNPLRHGCLKHMPCHTVHIFTTPLSVLKLFDPTQAANIQSTTLINSQHSLSFLERLELSFFWSSF